MLKDFLKKAFEKFLEKKEFNLFVFLFLLIVAILAFFVRVYRVSDLLGFYYDQGRDALRIWEFWYKGKPFLVGPTTGLQGIFLGPFYYYLIAPFYLVSGGNPIFPAIFLSFLSVVGIPLTFYLGWKMQNFLTGVVSSLISAFSYYIVLAGRWLANPTPILLTSVLIIFLMWRILDGGSKKELKFCWLLFIALVSISLHFEVASAVFYIPTLLVFYIFVYLTVIKSLPSIKTLFLGFLIFAFSLLPQIFFNFRHDNILLNNFRKVLIEEKSFRNPFSKQNFIKKKNFFWSAFNSKIFPSQSSFSGYFYLLSVVGILLTLKKNPKVIFLFLIFFSSAFIGYFLFQGNFGNIYDYYLTGYYIPMILLFSIGLGYFAVNVLGKLVIILFIYLFLNINFPLLKNFLSAGVDGETHITLGNQIQAVNWVLDKAGKEEFNLEVYVPPVIPYSYDYLFLWKLKERCKSVQCPKRVDQKVSLLFTLYEVDPLHPERLSSWLSRFNQKVVDEKRFGGVVVQQRIQI